MKNVRVIPFVAGLLFALMLSVMSVQAQSEDVASAPSDIGIQAPVLVKAPLGSSTASYNIQIINDGAPRSGTLRVSWDEETKNVTVGMENCNTEERVTACPFTNLTGVLTVPLTVELFVGYDGSVDQCVAVNTCKHTTVDFGEINFIYHIFLPSTYR